MRFHISYGVLALVLGAVPGQAQTLYTGPVVAQPAPTVIAAPPAVGPAETVRTTRTVHTVRRLVPVRERIVTTRTVTRRVMPAGPAVVAGRVAAPAPVYDTAVPVAAPGPAPLYDTAVPVAAPARFYDTTVPVAAPAPAPLYNTAVDVPGYGYADYGAPLYDVAPAVAPAAAVAAPAVAPPLVAAPVATAPMIYRYVYEPGRILVIDPTTGIAVQAIPR